MKATLFKISSISLFLSLILAGCEKDKGTEIEISETKIFDNAIPTDISFASKNIGYISASSEINTGTAVIAKTKNGGLSWEILPVYVEKSPSALIRNIYAKSIDSIYATYTSQDDRCGVCFSKDGGLTWGNLGLLPCGAAYNGIFFKTFQIGFICRAGDILQTLDGGNTWNTVFDWDGFGGIGKLFFTSNKIGYAYGGFVGDHGSFGTLLKTVDGGNTWAELTSLLECITCLNFIDNNVGYAFTFENNIYKTTDGGISWKLIKNLDGIGSLYYAAITDGKTKYLASGNSIFQSTDDFKTVTEIYKSTVSGAELSIKAAKFSNETIFFLSSMQSVIKIVQ
jgi:photosystem II stability/assembly factor-like uncharacterized protein